MTLPKNGFATVRECLVYLNDYTFDMESPTVEDCLDALGRPPQTIRLLTVLIMVALAKRGDKRAQILMEECLRR